MLAYGRQQVVPRIVASVPPQAEGQSGAPEEVGVALASEDRDGDNR
jgi:hypothetical protein